MHGDGGERGSFSARHRRARSPARTIIRWALLAVVMIVIIVVVGLMH
jgi:predicted anti-sigma-YlaC factor YlaD